MPMEPVTLTVRTPATRLYRRAADHPGDLTRPAVVQSRPIRTSWGSRSAFVPHRRRGWYVVSPWPIPGLASAVFGTSGGLTIARVSTHAEAVALATAAARQHAEVTT